MKPSILHCAATTCAAVLCACASGSEEVGEITSPATFSGFPSQARQGIVVAAATFYVNHEDVFDEDLIEDEGIIPIALKVGLRGEGQAVTQASISLDDMEACLYLPDGTALRSTDFRKLTSDDDVPPESVMRNALKSDLLEAWNETPEGFLYFRLPEDASYSDDAHMITRSGGNVVRHLDLMKSLCAFKVIDGRRLVQFYVGIQQDRYTK